MNANRRKFLGAIGATSVVSAIAVGQANAQSPTPPQTIPSGSVAPGIGNSQAKLQSLQGLETISVGGMRLHSLVMVQILSCIITEK